MAPLDPLATPMDQGQYEVTMSLTLLGPVLVWNQQNYLRLLRTMKVNERIQWYSKGDLGTHPPGQHLLGGDT